MIETKRYNNRIENKHFPEIQRLSQEHLQDLLGENYLHIHTEALNLEDRFGFCGVLSQHISGMLANKELFQDIAYDVKSMYQNMQLWLSSDGEKGEAARVKYWQDFHTPRIEEDQGKIIIQGMDNFHQVVPEINGNIGLIVSPFCEYPGKQGFHTHWISVTSHDCKTSYIGGDLTVWGYEDPLVIAPNQAILSAIEDTLEKINNTNISAIYSRLETSPNYICPETGKIKGNAARMIYIKNI